MVYIDSVRIRCLCLLFFNDMMKGNPRKKHIYVISMVVSAIAVAVAVLSYGRIADLFSPLISRWGHLEHLLFSQDMWVLILGGLKNTVVIFVFAAIFYVKL